MYSTAVVAAFLGFSQTKLRQFVRAGKVDAHTSEGGKLRFDAVQVLAYIQTITPGGLLPDDECLKERMTIQLDELAKKLDDPGVGGREAVLTVCVPTAIRDRVRETAEAHGCSMSTVVREGLRLYFEQDDTKVTG